MWVEVTGRKRNGFVGELDNTPIGIPRLHPGKKVRFTSDEIIDVIEETLLPGSKVLQGGEARSEAERRAGGDA